MKKTIKKQTENIKRKIVNYKVVRGIKRYIENMEFYEKNHKTSIKTVYLIILFYR